MRYLPQEKKSFSFFFQVLKMYISGKYSFEIFYELIVIEKSFSKENNF